MFIFWGTKGMTKKIESGDFHCPQCGPEKVFDVVQVKRWFTLYFIPLIPLGEAGRYIECRSCAGTFDEDARDYDPEVAEAEAKAYFEQMMLRAMVVMAKSDGHISHDELETIADVMTKLTNTAYETDAISRVADITGDEKLKTCLAEANERLAVEGKALVLQALVMVASSDGHMDPSEETMMYTAGKCLGIRKKDVKEFLEEHVANN